VKGERIIAEIISVLGLLIYIVALQHLYAQILNKPETSWINQARAWWVTRHSRARILKLERVWGSKDSAVEPAPENPA
jgi:hypothetical protein